MWLLWTRTWNFGVHKIWKISWIFGLLFIFIVALCCSGLGSWLFNNIRWEVHIMTFPSTSIFGIETFMLNKNNLNRIIWNHKSTAFLFLRRDSNVCLECSHLVVYYILNIYKIPVKTQHIIPIMLYSDMFRLARVIIRISLTILTKYG